MKQSNITPSSAWISDQTSFKNTNPLFSQERWTQLLQWVQQQFGAVSTLHPVADDASFRRYFRIFLSTSSSTSSTSSTSTASTNKHMRRNPHSLIIMDVLPHLEDVNAYVRLTHVFLAAGLQVPQIMAQNLKHGFLALTDFGDYTYAQYLQQQPHANTDWLYRQALQTLLKLQKQLSTTDLPLYDRTRLLTEMELFSQYFLKQYMQAGDYDAQALQQTFETILANNLKQPYIAIHRDYHSRNLMALIQPDHSSDELPHGEDLPPLDASTPALIDFQGAMYGPITYDVVSLLRDAYIEWDDTQAQDWLMDYWTMAKDAGLPVAANFSDFYRDYEWMGLQRHLKVLGIFARLYYRDGKNHYLKHLPLVFKYVQRVANRYNEFSPLSQLLDPLESTING